MPVDARVETFHPQAKGFSSFQRFPVFHPKSQILSILNIHYKELILILNQFIVYFLHQFIMRKLTYPSIEGHAKQDSAMDWGLGSYVGTQYY